MPCIWARVDELEHEVLAGDPRFLPSKHGGRRWIAVRADRRIDWRMLRELMAGAYRLVAPKPLVQKLDAPRVRARGRKSA